MVHATKSFISNLSLRNSLVIALGILCVAIGWKIFLLIFNVFPFNADEAIVALMGKHILAGERPVRIAQVWFTTMAFSVSTCAGNKRQAIQPGFNRCWIISDLLVFFQLRKENPISLQKPGVFLYHFGFYTLPAQSIPMEEPIGGRACFCSSAPGIGTTAGGCSQVGRSRPGFGHPPQAGYQHGLSPFLCQTCNCRYRKLPHSNSGCRNGIFYLSTLQPFSRHGQCNSSVYPYYFRIFPGAVLDSLETWR
jgi:hypothetical protein